MCVCVCGGGGGGGTSVQTGEEGNETLLEERLYQCGWWGGGGGGGTSVPTLHAIATAVYSKVSVVCPS